MEVPSRPDKISWWVDSCVISAEIADDGDGGRIEYDEEDDDADADDEETLSVEDRTHWIEVIEFNWAFSVLTDRMGTE